MGQPVHREEIDLLLAARTLMMEKSPGVDFNALTDYASGFDNWIALTNRQHLAECQDSDCDAIVCRAARGFPPLAMSDIEAERKAERERRQRLQERASEMLRRRFKHPPTSRNGTRGSNAADRIQR